MKPVTLNQLQNPVPTADALVVNWKRDRSTAGQTAEANYERLLKLWRQKMQLPLLLASAMMLLLAASFLLWAPHGEFFAGLAIGSVFGMANWIWSEPRITSLGGDAVPKGNERPRERSDAASALAGAPSMTAATAEGTSTMFSSVPPVSFFSNPRICRAESRSKQTV